MRTIDLAKLGYSKASPADGIIQNTQEPEQPTEYTGWMKADRYISLCDKVSVWCRLSMTVRSTLMWWVSVGCWGFTQRFMLPFQIKLKKITAIRLIDISR